MSTNFGYLTAQLNEARRSWVHAYSTASGYDADDIKDDDITKPWRSITAHPQSLVFDAGTKITVDLIALINHNLSDDATITVTAGDDVDCDDYTASPAISWRKNDAFTLLSAAQSYRFWKIAIDDPGNVEGFIQIGHVVIGDSTTMSIQFAHGWEYTLEFEHAHVASDFGVPHISERFSRRRYVFPFDHNISQSELEEVTDMLETLKGELNPVFVIPDISINNGYFGRFPKGARVRVPYKYRTTLEFLEDSRGVTLDEDQPFFYTPGDNLDALGVVFSRASTAYYINSSGVLTSVASGEYRDAHYPLGKQGPRTFLVEGIAVTNGITDPEDITAGGWSVNRATAPGGTLKTAGPDGSSDAYLLKADGTAANDHYASQDITCGNDDHQGITVFAKYGGAHIRLAGLAKDNVWSYLDVNLLTGANTASGDTINSEVVPLANGWFRVCLSFDADAGGTTPRYALYLMNPADYTDDTWDGDSESGVYVWGMMHEPDKGIWSTYHATTRASEVAYIDWSDLTEMTKISALTFYSATIDVGTSVLKSDRRILYLVGTAQARPRWLLYITNSGNAFYVQTSGVNQDGATAAGFATIGELLELRGVFLSDGTIKVGRSVEGDNEVTDTAATSIGRDDEYAGDERLYFGHSDSAGNNAYLAVKILYGEQTMNTCRRAQSGRQITRYA